MAVSGRNYAGYVHRRVPPAAEEPLEAAEGRILRFPWRQLLHALDRHGLCRRRPKNSPRNDLGWEIYPDGLPQAAAKLEKLLKRPIWVTENGTCDNQDAFRARYIYEHLHAMLRSGLPFERYYHWCFCDNFEWLEGESARFGLINVDYATQTRTIKRSGEFYADMIRNDGVTDEAYNTYVRGEVYRVE